MMCLKSRELHPLDKDAPWAGGFPPGPLLLLQRLIT